MAEYKRQDIVDHIVKLRIEAGASTKQIIEEYLKGECGFKTSWSYDLYKEARLKIEKLYDVKNKQLANEALGQLEDLYKECIKESNKKLALEVRKEINKLTGLYAADKIDITTNGESINIINVVIKEDENDEDE